MKLNCLGNSESTCNRSADKARQVRQTENHDDHPNMFIPGTKQANNTSIVKLTAINGEATEQVEESSYRYEQVEESNIGIDRTMRGKRKLQSRGAGSGSFYLKREENTPEDLTFPRYHLERAKVIRSNQTKFPEQLGKNAIN
jgi:hypothetical protein